MKTLFMILFPVVAFLFQVVTSKPFIVCLGVAVFLGMLAAAAYGLWDSVDPRRRYK